MNNQLKTWQINNKNNNKNNNKDKLIWLKKNIKMDQFTMEKN